MLNLSCTSFIPCVVHPGRAESPLVILKWVGKTILVVIGLLHWLTRKSKKVWKGFKRFKQGVNPNQTGEGKYAPQHFINLFLRNKSQPRCKFEFVRGLKVYLTKLRIRTMDGIFSPQCFEKHRPASRNMLRRAHRTLQGDIKKEKEVYFFSI